MATSVLSRLSKSIHTQVLQRPDLYTLDKNGDKHPLISNEAVARVFKRLADRLQGVVSDTSTITITPEYAAHFLEVYVKKTESLPFQTERAITFTPITVWSLNRICIGE